MPGGVYGYSGVNTVSSTPNHLLEVVDKTMIQAWYHAGFAVADGSGNISRLYDRSGNGRDATQGTTTSQPVLTQYKGFPTAYFNGSKIMGLTRPIQDDMTVIVVCAWTATHAATNWYNCPYIFGTDVGGVTNDFSMIFYSTTLGIGFGNPDITGAGRDALNDGNFHVGIMRRKKGSSLATLYADGVWESYLAPNNNSLNAAASIWLFGNGANAYMAEVIALSTCVDNTTRARIEALYMSRYGIAAPSGNMVLG